VLLQLMDDGRITDGQGRVVDAKNCIVVMTSNLGAEYLARPSGKDGKIDPTTKELVMNALRNYFLPEFLNRISSIVIFNRLTRREIRKIVDLRIAEIQKRLRDNDRNVTIIVSDAAKDKLGAAGYSPAYGARPLQRLLEKEVLNRLAILILRGNIRDGEVARVDVVDGKVTVIPNHEDEMSDEEMLVDEEDAVEEVAPDSMDEDIYD
jgi:ATP-dependent Clp protease ATP-binding subunit ClpB